MKTTSIESTALTMANLAEAVQRMEPIDPIEFVLAQSTLGLGKLKDIFKVVSEPNSFGGCQVVIDDMIPVGIVVARHKRLLLDHGTLPDYDIEIIDCKGEPGHHG